MDNVDSLIEAAHDAERAGAWRDALACYERAFARLPEEGDARQAADLLRRIGDVHRRRGEMELAQEVYEASRAIAEAGGLRGAAAAALSSLAAVEAGHGATDRAEALGRRARELADQSGGDRLIAEIDRQLGTVELERAEAHLKRGGYGDARESCDRAFEIFGRLGSDIGRGRTYRVFGSVYRETGKLHLARDHLHQAIALAHACHDEVLEAEVHSELALVCLAQGKNRDALRTLTRADRIFRALGARRELPDLDRRLDRLDEMFLRVVSAWAASTESQVRHTAGHGERVADYSCRLAEAQGITGRDLAWLRMGALLHDVGKVAVPAEVLNKPGELTPEERALVRRHTVIGDRIVAGLDLPQDIRPIVRSHHERWDGAGYPDGLQGEMIPLPARILCIADIFDALTTRRSYRNALPRSEALGIMEGEAGRSVDPDLFATFRTLLDERPSVSAGRREPSAP